jgi:hypothetical protein
LQQAAPPLLQFMGKHLLLPPPPPPLLVRLQCSLLPSPVASVSAY